MSIMMICVYIPSGSKESGDKVVFQESSIYQYTHIYICMCVCMCVCVCIYVCICRVTSIYSVFEKFNYEDKN